MKKLMMFAAAVTIAGGALADCSDPDVPVYNCSMVYNVKLNLKTVSGKARSGKVYNASDCSETAFAECVRFPKFPYALQGYLVNCDCACDGILTDTSVLYLWNSKLKSVAVVDEITLAFLHVLGKQNTAEVLWGFKANDTVLDSDFELALAGFGTYGKALDGNKYYTSFSGFAVGTLAEPKCLGDCLSAKYWLCEDLTDALDDDPSIMLGTWAVKLNSAASKEYSKDSNALYRHLPQAVIDANP